MDVRDALERRSHRTAFGLVAALACAASACLPSIAFDGATDGGSDGTTDGASPDGTGSTPEAATDAPVDATSDAITDAADASSDAPGDAPPDVAPRPGILANSTSTSFDTISACAVREAGLYCWGDPGSNAYGQLGFPDEDAGGTVGIPPALVTTTIQPASRITQLVMNGSLTCALYGTEAYCWGTNTGGQLGAGTSSNGGPTQVAVVGLPSGGLAAMAVASGTICGAGPPLDAGDVSNVYCWGYNGHGELGRAVATYSTSTPLPVIGNIDGGPLGVIPDAVQIAAGGSHVCAITSSGQILCWGATDYFECGPVQGPADCPGQEETTCTPQPLPVTLPDPNDRPASLALGDAHSCVLTEAGNVYCWGADDANQLGAASPTATCTTWYQPDASIPCEGTPVKIAITGVQHLYAGASTTCALDGLHHAHCWGNNGQAEVGAGNNVAYTTPQEVLDPVTGNPYTFDDMAVGNFSACGRDGDSVYCWGSGALGIDPDAGGPIYNSPPGLVRF